MSLKKLLPPPNEETEKYIKRKLKDDLERLPKTLDLFEDWIKHESYMPKNIDRSILQCVMVGCKFNLEKAKRKFSLLLYYRENVPELFSFPNSSLEDEMKANCGVIGTMPSMTPDGKRVAIISLLSDKLEDIDVERSAKFAWCQYTLRIAREELYLGDIIIVDCSNSRVPHVSLGLHPIVRKTLTFTLDAVPARIKAMYLVNAPSYVNKFIALISPLFKSKMRKRIIVDTGVEVLKTIPSECIPKDLGGTGITIEELKKVWWECIQEEKEWFETFSKFKIIGKLPKKLQKSTLNDDMGGVQGSFRRLDID